MLVRACPPPGSPAASTRRARARVAIRSRAFPVHQIRVLGRCSAGRDVLAVLPTGAGKSLCYQVPALLAPDSPWLSRRSFR